MKRIHRMVALLLAASMLTACGGQGSQAGSESFPRSSQVVEVEEATKEDRKNAQDFCYELLRTQEGIDNPVMSPISAYVAMGMVAEGAKGQTQTELANLLGANYRGVAQEVMQSFQKQEENLTLQISNAVWVDDELIATDEWVSVVGNVYQSPAYQRDLTAEGIVNEINGWVHSKTNGLIEEIVNEPFGEEARAALFNAIYFKGEWVTEFSEESTRPEDFTKEDGSVVQAQMMNAHAETFSYVKTEEAEGVVLPYKDGNLAYVAIKPIAGQSVRDILNGMNADKMSAILATKQDTLMNLKLPKYEVAYDETLNEALQSLGAELVFDDEKADLSGLGESEDGYNIFVSKVAQRAVLKVDEKGTEASAVTSIIIDAAGMAPMLEEPIDVEFNEPFLYMVMDMETEMPLFIGIVDFPN